MKLNDVVRIKSENITGTIVDISKRNGKTFFIVESLEKGGVNGKDVGEWPLYDCEKEDMEMVT